MGGRQSRGNICTVVPLGSYDGISDTSHLVPLTSPAGLHSSSSTHSPSGIPDIPAISENSAVQNVFYFILFDPSLITGGGISLYTFSYGISAVGSQ